MVTVTQETLLDLAACERIDSTGTVVVQGPESAPLRPEHNSSAAAAAEDARRRWAFPPLAAFPARLIR